VQQQAVIGEDIRRAGAAELQGRRRDAVEDRLGIGRRARNGAQDLGGGRLLFESIGQRLTARRQRFVDRRQGGHVVRVSG
jgi:hypothetical protein